MMRAGRRRCRNQFLDIDRRHYPSAELEQLQRATGGKFRAAQARRKTDKVFDSRRAAHLTTWTDSVDEQSRKAFGRGVYSRRKASGASSDDRKVRFLRRAWPPNAGRLRKLLQ